MLLNTNGNSNKTAASLINWVLLSVIAALLKECLIIFGWA